jgi:hypothetical protein
VLEAVGEHFVGLERDDDPSGSRADEAQLLYVAGGALESAERRELGLGQQSAYDLVAARGVPR